MLGFGKDVDLFMSGRANGFIGEGGRMGVMQTQTRFHATGGCFLDAVGKSWDHSTSLIWSCWNVGLVHSSHRYSRYSL